MATLQPTRPHRDDDVRVRAARRATVEEHEKASRLEFRASLLTFAILLAGIAGVMALGTLN